MQRILMIGITVSLAWLFSPAWSAQPTAPAKVLSVNQLAAQPDAYLGKVAIVGRVAAVTMGKGFTLIDTIKCGNCVSDCLTDKETKKIPFLWHGPAPTVKDVVQVEGLLAKTDSGYIFTAEQVTKQ
jgi:hypothetical protein